MNETDELYKKLKAAASQGKDCVVPVEFNCGHKKEIEVALHSWYYYMNLLYIPSVLTSCGTEKFSPKATPAAIQVVECTLIPKQQGL